MSTPEKLIALGWKEYPNQFRKYARSFYKRHDTPTRCACNNDKNGMQIGLSVSEFAGKESIEMEICGELSDGTWLKIQNYSLPSGAEAVIKLVPRCLSIWESAAQSKEASK